MWIPDIKDSFDDFFDLILPWRAKKKIQEGEAMYLAQFPPEERRAKKEEFDKLSLEERLRLVNAASRSRRLCF